MEIRIRCTGCGKRYRVPRELIGKYLKCKRCETFLEISDPLSEPVEAIEEFVEVEPDEDPDEVELSISDTDLAEIQTLDEIVAIPVEPLDLLKENAEEESPSNSGQFELTRPDVPATTIAEPTDNDVPPDPPEETKVSAQKKQPRAWDVNTSMTGGELIKVMMGSVLVVVGTVLMLLNLFKQISLGGETSGILVVVLGFLVGLVGVAILASGLAKMKLASFVSGSLAGIAVVGIFGATLWSHRQEVREESAQNLSRLKTNSVWKKSYPNWSFKTNQSGEATTGFWDNVEWPEYYLADAGVSVKVPTGSTPGLSIESLKHENQDLKVTTYRQSSTLPDGIFFFAVRHFRFPSNLDVDNTSKAKINYLERRLREMNSPLEYRSEETVVNGFQAKNISFRPQTDNGRRRVHLLMLARKDVIYVIYTSGPRTRVPGTETRKFMRSLKLDSAWSPKRQLGKEELQKSNEENLWDFGELSRNTPRTLAMQANPFTISDSELQRRNTITKRRREIESKMDRQMGIRVRLSFPKEYLSEPIGESGTNVKYFCHPEKLPMTGLDFTTVKGSELLALNTIAPIYDDEATDEKTIIAKEGYAIAGMKVNLINVGRGSSYIAGIQLIFMQPTKSGFDRTQEYSSPWLGTAAKPGTEITVGGDGRPVYGFWIRPGSAVRAIGLIMEPEFDETRQ